MRDQRGFSLMGFPSSLKTIGSRCRDDRDKVQEFRRDLPRGLESGQTIRVFRVPPSWFRQFGVLAINESVDGK